MKKETKILIFTLLTWIGFETETLSQEVQVVSLEENITCLDAAENEILDANGIPCALLKILFKDDNVVFKSDWIIHTETKNSEEHWVWLCEGTRDVTITSENFLPQTIVFSAYNSTIKGLKSRHTYELVLLSVQQSQSGSSVAIECNVPHASILVDGQQVHVGQVQLEGGKHRLKAFAEGYEPYVAEVDVNPYSKRQTIGISMVTAITTPQDQVEKGHHLLQTGAYSEAARWYLKAARQGDAEGQYQMGMLYLRGWGVVDDRDEAEAYFLLAAHQNHPQAVNMLGELRLDAADYANAKAFFERAVNLGNITALANLGYLYEQGKGVEKDLALAEKNYKKAAKKKDPRAYQLLADWYSKQGKKKWSEVVKYTTLAAKGGNEVSMKVLGWMYRYSQYGVKYDAKESVYWYKKAEQYNNPHNYVDIGVFYQDNYEIAKAIHYYKKAAIRGDVNGMKKLCELYKNNNDTAYFLWLGRAARMGDANSAFQVGMRYFSGRYEATPQKNIDSCCHYYSLAAQALGVERDNEPLRQLQLIASYGQPEAYYYLGMLYEQGNWNAKDSQTAIGYYRMAYRRNKYQPAKEALTRLGMTVED